VVTLNLALKEEKWSFLCRVVQRQLTIVRVRSCQREPIHRFGLGYIGVARGVEAVLMQRVEQHNYTAGCVGFAPVDLFRLDGGLEHLATLAVA